MVTSLQREAEERSDAKAVGLSSLMCHYKFVATLHLLCDVLPHVSYLSKCFQFSDCDYSAIPLMLGSCLNSLKQLISTDGNSLSELPLFLQRAKDAGIDMKMSGSENKDLFSRQVRKPYLEEIIKNLEQRFEDKSIMSAFSILDPRRIPDDPELFVQYGNTEIEALCRQFECALPDDEECLSEWSAYKQYVGDNLRDVGQEDIINDLSTNSKTSGVFKNLSHSKNLSSDSYSHCRRGKDIFNS